MDKHTPEQRRRNMQHVKSKDTSIEIRLRKALWHAGIRYRKNYHSIPGNPDIAITKYKIAVFCDSSFFHGRDFETRKKPETNTEFWNKKIERNIQRDEEVNRQLKSMGWIVLRFWDFEIKKRLNDCVQTISDAVLDAKISQLDENKPCCSEEPLFLCDP